MKKTVFALLIAILLQMICIPVNANVMNTEYEEMVGLFSKLGILTSATVENFSADKKITKAEYVELLLKTIGEQESTAVYKASGEELKGYAARATELGVVRIDGSEIIHTQLTAENASVMTLRALGYDKVITGTYMSKAAELDLLDGIKNPDAMTQLDAIVMLYNLLETPLLLDNFDGTMSVDTHETVLSRFHKLEKGEGIVTGTEKSRLTTIEGTSRGTVEISGKEYYIGDTNAEKYFGYRVVYYYSTERDSEDELVYINYHRKANDLILYSDDIIKYQNNKYSYAYNEVEKRQRTARVSTNADIIYNNTAMMANPAVYMIPESGYVVLIDNDDNNEYETVFIYDVNVVVYAGYDKSAKTIYDRFDSTNAVLIDINSEDVSLKTQDGKLVEWSDIQENDVIEIVASDSETAEITIIKQKKAGTVEGFSDDGAYEALIVDGEKLRISRKISDYMTANSIEFGLNRFYEFILDSRRNIVGFIYQKTDEEGKYGCLITAKYRDDEERVELKLLTEGGEMKKLFSAEKIRIDNVRYEDASAAAAILQPKIVDGEGKKSPAMIFYKANELGEITHVDTTEVSAKEEESSLHITGTTTRGRANRLSFTIDGVINYNESTTVFIIPELPDTATDDEYSVVAKAPEYITHYKYYAAKAYARVPNQVIADVIMVVDDVENRQGATKDIYFVEKIGQGLNHDDETVTVIDVKSSQGTTEKVCFADSTVSAEGINGTPITLKKGDVITISKDVHNEITRVQVVYSPKSDELYLTANPTASNLPVQTPSGDLSSFYKISSDFGRSQRFAFFNVWAKDDVYLRMVSPIFDLSSVLYQGLIKDGTITVENHKASNVFVYDYDDETYNMGSITDIRDYYTSKIYSRVLLMTSDSVVQVMVVYK